MYVLARILEVIMVRLDTAILQLNCSFGNTLLIAWRYQPEQGYSNKYECVVGIPFAARRLKP